MPAAKTEFVLGPATQHVESESAVTPPAVGKGRRGISFHPTTPTSPGGNVHLTINPAADPADIAPLNVYAFFVQPVSGVPTGAALTPDWFFASKAPNASVGGHMADASGALTITVPGVKPSLQPYHCQTIMEFPVQ